MAPQQGEIVRSRRNEAPGETSLHRSDTDPDHFRVARQLMQQPPQDHGVRIGDRIVDHSVVGRPQFRPRRHLELGHALHLLHMFTFADLRGAGRVESRSEIDSV